MKQNCGQEVADDASGVDLVVVPVEDELGLHFQWPLLLHPLQKHFEGADDVDSVYSGPPGHHIGVDEALTVVEGNHHLLDLAGLALDVGRGSQYHVYKTYAVRLSACYQP